MLSFGVFRGSAARILHNPGIDVLRNRFSVEGAIPAFGAGIALEYQLSPASYFYAVFAVAMISIRPFTGKVYDSIGPKFVIIPSFMLFAIGLVMLAYADGTWLFLASAIFIGAGYGTLTTSFQSLCVQAVSPKRSGYATATYFTLFDIGIALGSYILGIVAVKWSYASVYNLSAFLLVVVFVLYAIFFARKQPKKA